MSVIQTIRNKYGKIAGAVIAIALIGFIISDARNGSFGNFFGGHDNNIMKVNGTNIDPKEYQTRLKEYETLYTMFNKGRSLDDASRAQMNEQIVQNIVYETIVDEQCDKLGIQTTEEEKNELIYGANADPIVKQFQIDGNQIFINPQTNAFDPQIIKWMEKQFKDDPQKIDPTGKLQEQWNAVTSYVKRMNRINKFNILFSGSVYPPLYMAKRVVTDQNSMAAIKYVKIPFITVADNEVKVTDDDLKEYVKKHSALFQADQPARSIEYVSFDINPSSADTSRILDALTQIKNDFAATKDKDNKSFVNNKSDDPGSFTGVFVNKRTFMSKFADTIMTLPVGEIYGPYFENGSYRLSKIVEKKTLPDSVKLRHIMIKTKAQGKEIVADSTVKTRIDSIAAAIAGGASFDSMVIKYSEDDGSNKKGGEYTFTLQQKPTLDSAFGEFIFNGKAGDKKVVKADNGGYSGYHYVEIIEQNGIAPAVEIATVSKNLVPSDSTVNAIYGKANEFAGKNPTAAAFDDAVKKQNLDKRMGDNVKINSFTIPGLGASRDIIKWMFEHKIGDISQVFQLGEQRYVVAKLTAITDKGLGGITPMNRHAIEQKVKEEKKAEIIKKKYGSVTSLDALAQTSNQQVQQADSVMLGGAYIPNLGYEPKVVGYAFCQSFQPNTISPGIKGQGGVYYITVLNRINATTDPNMMQQMIQQQRTSYDGQMKNAMGQMLPQFVTKMADVKYYPANF
ncbi:MAG: peptidylprolyl isomerase [Sphingobacteriales bacterium]